ncbi:MAG: DUF4830 domain-containing protein [Candidatus Howiella sp.]|jgi:hypothetical protein
MKVLTFSLDRRMRFALMALVLMVAALLAASALAAAGSQVVSDGADTAQRLAFLSQNGYVCEGETARQIRIPDQLDEVYTVYNSIQIEQGYNLGNYLGRTVDLYTYVVTNYAGEDAVYAHLLVCDGVIIGGDISSARLDGFMHGIVQAH